MTNLEPEEFEAGENVTDKVRRNKSGGIVVSVRLTKEDSDALVRVAEESGKTVSQVARQAIRAFLSQRAQHPTFVPEITGDGPNVNIVAFGNRSRGLLPRVLQRPPRSPKTKGPTTNSTQFDGC